MLLELIKSVFKDRKDSQSHSRRPRRPRRRRPPRSAPIYDFCPLKAHTDEIRLLYIEPDDWEAPIRCRLRVVRLNDPYYTYRTLSYVWGTSESQQGIYIDGKAFAVRPNLFDAIRRLRTRRDGRDAIWMDAICIDQNDPVERSHQVALMSRIYTQCRKVLVWLGEPDQYVRVPYHPLTTPDDNCDRALRAAHDIGCQCQEKAWARSVGWRGASSLIRQAAVAMLILRRFATVRVCEDLQICRLFADVDEMIAFRFLMRFIYKCSWFARIWVVQEFVLAPTATFCIGPHVFSFEALYNAATVWEFHSRHACCTANSDSLKKSWLSSGVAGRLGECGNGSATASSTTICYLHR